MRGSQVTIGWKGSIPCSAPTCGSRGGPGDEKGGGWKKEWKRRDGRNRAEPVALNRMVVRRGRAARVCRLVV